MKIIAKTLAALLVIAILVIVSGYLYFFRDQNIEVQYIPSEFRYCDRVISENDPEYQVISNWLRSNIHGWTQDWNTPVAGLVYSYPAFSVVVFKGGVSVSYKTDYGFSRFIKSVDHNLAIECARSS